MSACVLNIYWRASFGINSAKKTVLFGIQQNFNQCHLYVRNSPHKQTFCFLVGMVIVSCSHNTKKFTKNLSYIVHVILRTPCVILLFLAKKKKKKWSSKKCKKVLINDGDSPWTSEFPVLMLFLLILGNTGILT